MDKGNKRVISNKMYLVSTGVMALFLYFGLRRCIYYKIDLIIVYSVSLAVLFAGLLSLYLYNRKYIKNSLYLVAFITLLIFIWGHVFNNYSEVKISPFPLMGIFLIFNMNKVIADFKNGIAEKLQLFFCVTFMSLIMVVYFCKVGVCFSQGQVLKNQVISYLKHNGTIDNIHSIKEYPEYTIVIFKDEKEIEYRYEFKKGKVVQRSLYTPQSLNVFKNIENKDVMINNK